MRPPSPAPESGDAAAPPARRAPDATHGRPGSAVDEAAVDEAAVDEAAAGPAGAACLAAADLLWQCWREGRQIEALPEAIRPRDRRAAYAVQAQIETRAPGPLAGWKIAATSAAGQAHIRVSGPIAGRLPAGRCHADGASLKLAGNFMHLVEPEFAFVLARELPPRTGDSGPWSVAEVMDAVATLHPALEVPSSRYYDVASAGEAQIIADNACAHDFVLGPAAPPDWRTLDLAAHVVRAEVGRRFEREGRGANVDGHPARALTWLANELNSLGEGLRAGQFVTTGTCMAPLAVLAGEAVTADFGALGQVSLRFED